MKEYIFVTLIVTIKIADKGQYKHYFFKKFVIASIESLKIQEPGYRVPF
jgi:hypothetical protein